MNNSFECICPYCEHENERDLVRYENYLDKIESIRDVCDMCGEVFLVDIEIEVEVQTFAE